MNISHYIGLFFTEFFISFSIDGWSIFRSPVSLDMGVFLSSLAKTISWSFFLKWNQHETLKALVKTQTVFKKALTTITTKDLIRNIEVCLKHRHRKHRISEFSYVIRGYHYTEALVLLKIRSFHELSQIWKRIFHACY